MKRDPPPPTPPPRVLLLEDHMLIMLQAEDVLRSGGYAVASAASLRAAHKVLESQAVDAAVLNINLGGANSFPVAEELQLRRIPFLFTSGHSAAVIPARFKAVPLLPKPCLPSDLLAGVTLLLLERQGCRA